MARLESHTNGLLVLVITRSELQSLERAYPVLLGTFLNSHAEVSGTVSPLKLQLSPSWNKGFPFQALNQKGDTEIEISRKALTGTLDDATSLTNLTVGVSGKFLVVSQTEATKREAIKGEKLSLTEATVRDLLREKPREEHELRLAFRHYSPTELDEVVGVMRDRREVIFDGDQYYLFGDQRSRTKPVSRPVASTIMRALRRNAEVEKEFSEVLAEVEIDDEELDVALESLARVGRVFVHEGRFSLPEPERRRALTALVVDALHDTETSLTLDEIVAAAPAYHPAWTARIVRELVEAGSVQPDGDHFAIVRAEPTKAIGLHRVRDLVRDAKAENKPITIADLYATLSDVKPWLIRQNLRTLVDGGKITIEGDQVIWSSNQPTGEPKRARTNIREEIRAYLTKAGNTGVRREVVLDYFEKHRQFSHQRTSVALAEMCNNGQVRFADMIYRIAPKRMTEWRANEQSQRA